MAQASVHLPTTTAKQGDWRFDAKCRDKDPELFFTKDMEFTARLVCGTCPVIEECRTYVDTLERDVPYDEWEGVWAGEVKVERKWRRIRAAR